MRNYYSYLFRWHKIFFGHACPKKFCVFVTDFLSRTPVNFHNVCSYMSEFLPRTTVIVSYFWMSGHKSRAIREVKSDPFRFPPCRVYVALVGRPAQRSGQINLAYQPAHRRIYDNNKNTKTHFFSVTTMMLWSRASVFPPLQHFLLFNNKNNTFKHNFHRCRYQNQYRFFSGATSSISSVAETASDPDRLSSSFPIVSTDWTETSIF